MLADVWFTGLAPWLYLGIFEDTFDSGDLERWTSSIPN